MLHRYPRLKLSQKFQDSHVYVCKRTILDVLKEKERFESFREDFLPWLCKVQYQKSKRSRFQPSACVSFREPIGKLRLASPVLQPSTNTPSQSISKQHSTLYNDTQNQNNLRVGLVIHRDTSFDQSAIRVNTLPAYMDANRRVCARSLLQFLPRAYFR
jgi:translation initiation factor eIF-2B subunit gamma